MGSDETVTSGTDESVPYDYGFWYRQNHSKRASNARPYGVRQKTQIRTNVARGKYGFVGSFDTGLPEIYVSVGDPMRL